jgi:predicted GIY-YIG superfamily endonuclease
MKNLIFENSTDQACMYLLKHVKSGKIYVGSTKCLRTRFKEHRKKLRKGTHKNRPLQNAYNDDPEMSVHLYLTETRDEARKLEQDYLDKHFASGNLFNIALDINSVNKGRKLYFSAESIEKRRQKIKGRIKSDEERSNISKGLRKALAEGKKFGNSRSERKLSIEGVVYENIHVASKALGLSTLTLHNRLNNNAPKSRFTNWFFLSE